MITIIAVGLGVATACLGLQSLTALIALKYFIGGAAAPGARRRAPITFRSMALLMVVLSIGSIVQMIAWALVYMALGQFGDFETALYFSGVTFTSLGFGDITLIGTARLLAPLQAANGLMMFGFSTAVLINALHRSPARHGPR